MINLKLDETKVKIFNEYILEEYARDLVVEDITDVNFTDKTDGTFTQVGIRPLIDLGTLTEPNYDPRLTMAGRIVATGERDLLVHSILESEIKRIKLDKTKLSPEELQKYLSTYWHAKIIISVDIEAEILKNKEWFYHIKFMGRKMKFNGLYDIIPVPTNIMTNTIIIIGDSAFLWTKQLFPNKITNKSEKLDIHISDTLNNGKLDITIRSVNKFEIMNPENIKIIDVN